ncbi:uncharacterized protein LOC142560405 isoform X1 [Dermacentor variabilis]|uniref:uncharacterized protein LOC142560405 isoform X1 n=1 Tax=Dermacentor variabilis TaxID=34621 RepID=UPI003F5C803E
MPTRLGDKHIQHEQRNFSSIVPRRSQILGEQTDFLSRTRSHSRLHRNVGSLGEMPRWSVIIHHHHAVERLSHGGCLEPPLVYEPGQIVTLAMSTAHGSTYATASGRTLPPVPATLPLYGRLEPFEGGGFVRPVYEEQVHVFFGANDRPEAKQRDVFQNSCETRIINLLLNLLKPSTPHVKTMSNLLTTLWSHFSPALSIVMEQFHFNNRSHREGETLRQFITSLRGLASAGTFGDQQNSLLRDRFVCGINNSTMQTRLLELPDPSLDDT